MLRSAGYGRPSKDAVAVDGKSVELRTSGGFIQWRQTDGAWANLVSIASLTGGNGKSVELQTASGKVQWRQEGGTWADLFTIPAPADGKSAEMRVDSGNIQWRQAGGTWATLVALSTLKGEPGAGNTLVGQVVVGQTAAVAIAVGIREVTVALTGTVAGERYSCFARSYKLNGGAPVAGRPSGYAIVDCVCNSAGQVTVSLNAPLLVVGSSYAITCDIVRINAA